MLAGRELVFRREMIPSRQIWIPMMVNMDRMVTRVRPSAEKGAHHCLKSSRPGMAIVSALDVTVYVISKPTAVKTSVRTADRRLMLGMDRRQSIMRRRGRTTWRVTTKVIMIPFDSVWNENSWTDGNRIL